MNNLFKSLYAKNAMIKLQSINLTITDAEMQCEQYAEAIANCETCEEANAIYGRMSKFAESVRTIVIPVNTAEDDEATEYRKELEQRLTSLQQALTL